MLQIRSAPPSFLTRNLIILFSKLGYQTVAAEKRTFLGTVTKEKTFVPIKSV